MLRGSAGQIRHLKTAVSFSGNLQSENSGDSVTPVQSTGVTPAALLALGWCWDAALWWYSHPRYGGQKFTFAQACAMEMTNG
jgi:hypothetical protein